MKIALKRSQFIIPVFLIVSILPALTAYYSNSRSLSLKAIQQRGSITMLTANNATSYYLYREEPLGFEYELARKFADHIGVKLKIITPGWSNLFEYLNTGQGDFIAAGMTRTDEREQIAAFTDEYLQIQQNIIVHKTNHAVKELADLDGLIIHVRQDTTYQQRLEELQKDGLGLILVLHKNMATEELIQKVAEKKIDVTVADSNIALLNRHYYPDIKILFPIEKKQFLAWAVRQGENDLRNSINSFFKKIKADGTLARIYERYYSAIDTFDYFDLKKFHERLVTRLPQYKPLIQQHSQKYGFDWRMIAAVIYQESHFDPQATSYTGVRGMMQLTQATATEMGISDRLDPAQSIEGGIRYLSKMYHRLDDVINPQERLLLALASYNIGYGHVRDAQNIAREMGLAPDKWESLKTTLPLLRKRKYYKKTKYGYARGTEPLRYINRVLTYYDILKRKSVRQNEVAAAINPESHLPAAAERTFSPGH